MKTYKYYATAVKHGATESVIVDGEQRWATPGIRPNSPNEARFAMMLGGQPADGHDRVATFGAYEDVYVMRVDGIAGGHLIYIFTDFGSGEAAFAEFVDRYSKDKRWAAK